MCKAYNIGIGTKHGLNKCELLRGVIDCLPGVERDPLEKMATELGLGRWQGFRQMKTRESGEALSHGVALTFALSQQWSSPLRPGLVPGAGFDFSVVCGEHSKVDILHLPQHSGKVQLWNSLRPLSDESYFPPHLQRPLPRPCQPPQQKRRRHLKCQAKMRCSLLPTPCLPGVRRRPCSQ